MDKKYYLVYVEQEDPDYNAITKTFAEKLELLVYIDNNPLIKIIGIFEGVRYVVSTTLEKL
jgi:hypothetical protein